MTSPDDHIYTYLVDDHPAILEAIRNRIEQTMDIEVCGTAGAAEDAFPEIEETDPDVAVVDISLSDAHGLDLVQNIRAQHSDVQVVVYSMYDEKIYAERALQAGASGYVMKEKSIDSLIEAIRTVNEGDVFLSQKMTTSILNQVAGGSSPDLSFPVEELTDRELAVVRMLGEGYNLEEIQDRLNLARKTVETYRRRAKEKLGYDSVSELIHFAVRWTSAPDSDS